MGDDWGVGTCGGAHPRLRGLGWLGEKLFEALVVIVNEYEDNTITAEAAFTEPDFDAARTEVELRLRDLCDSRARRMRAPGADTRQRHGPLAQGRAALTSGSGGARSEPRSALR